MKIATWNVNSIRTRLEHVLNWLQTNPVDLLCLQETKVKDEAFPHAVFNELGWHCEHHGQPAYNGVALISKAPLENVQRGFPTGDLGDQKRVISATLNGVRVINVYVPQGQAVDSPKFVLKENFYAELTQWIERQNLAQEPLVVCGDFNIAPAAEDTHDVEKMKNRVMFTEVEHTWFNTLLNTGLHDSLRLISDAPGIFSWWDYREASFQRDKGLRIDHHLVSTSLKEKVEDVLFYRHERSLERPSDHIPVMLDLNV